MRAAAGRHGTSGSRQGALLGLVARYALLAFGGSWACWFAATALLVADAAGGLHTLAGVLQVMGTLMPPLVAYALFGRVKACGLAGSATETANADDGDGRPDRHAGFWRFAFGGVPPLRGWIAFALLAVWRWAMFRAAFGFPETPADALANFFATLPALLLGGGLEEIGWRGVLQPALTAFFGDLLGGRRVRGVVGEASATGAGRGQVAGALLAPLATGVVWAVWHLPLFTMPGSFQNGMDFLPFMGVAVALSYSFGAVRALGGTLVFPILCHAWYNAMLVAVPQPCALGFALFAVEALAGAAVLIWHVRRKGAPAERTCG